MAETAQAGEEELGKIGVLSSLVRVLGKNLVQFESSNLSGLPSKCRMSLPGEGWE
ncbi:uncharacterized protein J3R85_015926 [Psidium guajava]|nr:uncharacterized protein J3R85_015926 [Psidium guajava]